MDVYGKFLIIPKHRMIRKKQIRRSFHDEESMPLMQDLASQYSQARGEDFLIVQVVAEVSKPKNGKKGSGTK